MVSADAVPPHGTVDVRSSAGCHGVALVYALLAAGGLRVLFRPHPRSGVTDPEFTRANEAIIDSIAAAARQPSLTAVPVCPESTE